MFYSFANIISLTNEIFIFTTASLKKLCHLLVTAYVWMVVVDSGSFSFNLFNVVPDVGISLINLIRKMKIGAIAVL